MSGFAADWLALREPFDAAARSAALAAELCASLAASHAAGAIEIVDLACGTGANVRYLAPRLGGRQRWTIVDHDARLLAALAPCMREWATRAGYRLHAANECIVVSGERFEAEVRPVEHDLARGVDGVVRAGVHLVTASALLDLVSGDWLARLAAACRSARAVALFALTYDGEIAWSPADPDDAAVRDAVNRHQRTDKGFGAALGPAAAGHAGAVLRAEGFEVAEARSDWDIGPATRAMQQALLDGWRAAAIGIAPAAAGAFTAWAARRAAAIAAGRAALRVGHRDLAARPA